MVQRGRPLIAYALLVLTLLVFAVDYVVATDAGSVAAKPYHVSEDCNARHLNADNFEHDTQATTGMTSGNWLLLFVPSNEGVTTQHYSQQVVHEIETFKAFVRMPREVLHTYQVIPAYVLCDESPALCHRFNVEKLSSKVVILGGSRLYPYPSDRIRSVDDVELFVTIFRRIQSSAIPPVRQPMAVWGQLVLLVVGVVGIFVVRSYTMSHVYAPLPKDMARPPMKED